MGTPLQRDILRSCADAGLKWSSSASRLKQTIMCHFICRAVTPRTLQDISIKRYAWLWRGSLVTMEAAEGAFKRKPQNIVCLRFHGEKVRKVEPKGHMTKSSRTSWSPLR